MEIYYLTENTMFMVGKLIFILLLPVTLLAQVGKVEGPFKTLGHTADTISMVDLGSYDFAVSSIAKDFDYTFYTMHASIGKGLKLFLPRKIRKEGNKLYISSLNDLSSVQEFTIICVGMQADKPTELVYQNKEMLIYISPLYGWLQIGNARYY